MATITVPGMFLTGNHAGRPSSGVGKGTLYSCTTHSLVYQTTDTGSTWVTWATLGTAASGSITASGYTQATARLLGRTTASSGAIEEITVGSGLSLSAGSLTATGGAAFSGAKAYTTGVAISGAVITFASEVYDTDSYHDTSSNTSRMTVPTTAKYDVKATGFCTRTDARLSIYVNGAIVRGGNTAGASVGNYAFAHGVFNLTANDYVEIFANTVASTTFGDNGSIGDNFTFTVTRIG